MVRRRRCAHLRQQRRPAPTTRLAPAPRATPSPSGRLHASSHASTIVGEVGAQALVDHALAQHADRAPETRPRRGGTGCGPSSRPTTARRPASPSLREIPDAMMLEEAAEDRAHADVLRHARHARAAAHARAAHDQVDLHAGAAMQRRARGSRPPRPARSSWRRCARLAVLRVAGLAADHLSTRRCIVNGASSSRFMRAALARLVMCRKTSFTSAQMSGSAVSRPKSV